MRLLSTLLLFCFASTIRADDKGNPLAEARLRWLKGNYAEARELYQEQLKSDKLGATAAIGVARTYLNEGEIAKALEVLDAALKKADDNADLLAAKADLLYQTGKWDEALKLAEKIIKEQDEHFLARWVRARIYRDRGDMKNAAVEMRWFVRTYTRRSQMDADIKVPDELLIVGQAGAEHARWNSLSDQFQFILSEVYGDVLKIEPACWMAEYLAGSMLLEKMNLPEAVSAFDKALKLNPRSADAFVGKGQAALIKFETKDAELFAEQALKINPHLPAALRLMADIHLLGGEIGKAVKALEEAREVNDRDEETLGRLAACGRLLKQSDRFEKIVAEVKAFDSKPGLFYYVLAAALDERKFYFDAEKYYKLSIELNDKLAGPKNALGLLAMRLGKETEAHKLLDAAFEFDPYNVRVANSRKVLKHLTGYETKESAHFTLRFDPKTDRILAEFVLDFLEQIYAQLSKDFNFQPNGKILVEVFSTHEMFSGRTVALPDLYTIGACTGKMFAMASPTAKGLQKKFNWARVIRHEMVHIFNLAQTDFQVPHWLTEGLAVRNEGVPRLPSWNATLRERFEKNDLLNLDNILLAFVRPRSQDEWGLAYCQSLLYVEYLIKEHGIGAVGKMLDAYRDGLETGSAIKKVCGVDKAEFEKGYRAYVTGIVKAIPVVAKTTEKPMTLKELEKEHEKTPDNLDIAAALAAEYARRRQPAEAKKLAEQVLEKKKGHPVASIVQARFLIADGKEDDARKLIEEAVAINGNDVRLLSYLGKLCLDSKEFTAAAKLFEKCRKLDPLDDEWLRRLRDIYTKLDEPAKLIDVLNEIASRDADDLQTRKELAKLLLEAKEYAQAEEVAREAIYIDILDAAARKMLLEALRKQKKDDEAEKILKRYGDER
jgi:cellulose synthase operon protein C